MLKGTSEEEANATVGAVDGSLPSRKRKQVSHAVIAGKTGPYIALRCLDKMTLSHVTQCIRLQGKRIVIYKIEIANNCKGQKALQGLTLSKAYCHAGW